jgi:hypothetical protein
LDENGFRNLLLERKLPEEVIEANISYVKEFSKFLNKKSMNIDNANTDEIQKYVSNLREIKNDKIKENLLGIVRYYIFKDNKKMIIHILEMIDGIEVMKILKDEVEKELGEEMRDKIFADIELPVIGTDQKEKILVTKEVMERMDSLVEKEKCHKIMTSGLHRLGKEGLLRQREKYLKAENIDDFLVKQRKDFLERLENHKKNNTLFYTQEIDDEVIEHIRNDPTIEYGTRVGDKVICSKIPYMTKKYLHEKDERMKKYYYCHCTWVREAIKTGKVKISPTFCACSAGFYKQQWDVILDQPVRVDVLETILDGDPVCKFAVHLPKEVVEKVEEK